MLRFFGMGSAKSADPDAAALVNRVEAQFPLPAAELSRLRARRWILERLPKGGVGAEIGVFRGHFSEMICEHLAPRRLYLIDPWRLCGPHFGWGNEYTNDNTLTTQAALDQTIARMAAFPDVEAIVIEGFYPAVDAQIAEPLDFVYLDAGHRYQETLNELRVVAHRMAPGGIIFGDDWRPSPLAAHHGVYRAVQDFVSGSQWEVMAAGPAGQWAICRTNDRHIIGASLAISAGKPLTWNDLPPDFMPIDQEAFRWVLRWQSQNAEPGDLAQIGRMPGRAAVILGEERKPGEGLALCVAGPVPENLNSFRGLIPNLPTLSTPGALNPATCRFLHLGRIDDIEPARALLRADGVMAVAGNAKRAGDALWQRLREMDLHPICHTDFTLYACAGDPAPLQAEIARAARETDWCTTAPPVLTDGVPVFRLHRKT